MNERRFWIIMAALCAGVGAGVTVGVRLGERSPAAEPAITREPPRTPIPDVATVLRALKLVTVEVHTSVEAASEDPSWRGDASARVKAPVTFYYGVDLSDLGPARVARSPLSGGYVLRLPAPRRLATEIAGEDALATVRVTGLRFREVAGEYRLGLARLGLYDAARGMVLGPAQREELERATREQVARLVRSIAGPGTPVEVVFDAPAEGPGPDAANAGEAP